MCKKKLDKSAATMKAKDSKKEKLSVSAMLARMDQRDECSSSRAKAVPKKASSYTDGLDLPSSDEDEEDEGVSDEEQRQKNARRKQKSEQRQLDISVTDKEQRRRVTRERLALEAAETAKREALKEDHDAFTVVIGSKNSVLEGEDTKDANVKDISIDSFSVSVSGKQLLKNVSLRISQGRRYGLVGPNGTGKSTLLKLLAWRKIPVPKNTDILFVEQEVVGDDKSAVESVVSANEKLVKLREAAAALENDLCSGADGSGEKLGEVYERLYGGPCESDAAEAKACKILSGLGFTKEMQMRPTKSFSGGWRMRISLARALFLEPKLLLLDEPTNHLDLRAVYWLDDYLCRWKTCWLLFHMTETSSTQSAQI